MEQVPDGEDTVLVLDGEDMVPDGMALDGLEEEPAGEDMALDGMALDGEEMLLQEQTLELLD